MKSLEEQNRVLTDVGVQMSEVVEVVFIEHLFFPLGSELVEGGDSSFLGGEVATTLVSPLTVVLVGSVDDERVIAAHRMENLLDSGTVPIASGDDARVGDPGLGDGGDGGRVAHMRIIIVIPLRSQGGV